MKNYWAILILSVFLFSCSKDEAASSFDENLKIKMIENIDNTSRKLTLHCFTEKNFPCSNYFIENSFTVSENKITIHFIEIKKPNICLTSIGPAYADIDLGSLVNKNYDIEINVGKEKISGQLLVSTGSFKANIPSQNKIQFINPILNRIPDNTIFGTVHYHNSSTSPTVQKFIDSLQILGATTAIYTPGDYGRFHIEANGQIKQTQDLGYYFTRYYIFNFTGNSGQCKDLVRRFGITYPDALLITLNNSNGQTFYSWTP
jgi:hypothetical protein